MPLRDCGEDAAGSVATARPTGLAVVHIKVIYIYDCPVLRPKQEHDGAVRMDPPVLNSYHIYNRMKTVSCHE